MIEAISAAGIEPTQSLGASAANQTQATQHDIRDFAAAMQKTGGAEATQAAEPAAVQSTSQADGAGRKLLAMFDSINSGATSIEAVASKVGAGGEFSPSQIIQLTMECHEFMFKTQMTSNVANRTSDGIQQLFRQQS